MAKNTYFSEKPSNLSRFLTNYVDNLEGKMSGIAQKLTKFDEGFVDKGNGINLEEVMDKKLKKDMHNN
jgi:hypothetical protein